MSESIEGERETAKTMNVGFFVVAVVAVVAAAVVERAEAIYHVVGDSVGWRIPPAGANNTYASWASNHTFAVGDTLVFIFEAGADDVALVSQEDFEACNDTDPIFYTTIGPVDVEIKAAGDNYFISTKTGHCAGGQKLAITAKSNQSNPTSPSSSPHSPAHAPSTTTSTPQTPWPEPTPSGATAPTPHNSASSFHLHATNFPFIFISIIAAIALLRLS